MSEINWLKVRKNLLFVNKKKQKNFVNFVLGLSAPGQLNKSFCFFFQKEGFFLHVNLLISFIIIPACAKMDSASADRRSSSTAIR